MLEVTINFIHLSILVGFLTALVKNFLFSFYQLLSRREIELVGQGNILVKFLTSTMITGKQLPLWNFPLHMPYSSVCVILVGITIVYDSYIKMLMEGNLVKEMIFFFCIMRKTIIYSSFFFQLVYCTLHDSTPLSFISLSFSFQ